MENKKLLIIESIDIKNLFEIFNYNIQYPKDENVLIITGPNGFGKTQVLNILFNLFNQKFVFFQSLVFDEITVKLSDDISIEIIKKQKTINSKIVQNGAQLIFFLKRKKRLLKNTNSVLKLMVIYRDFLINFFPFL